MCAGTDWLVNNIKIKRPVKAPPPQKKKKTSKSVSCLCISLSSHPLASTLSLVLVGPRPSSLIPIVVVLSVHLLWVTYSYARYLVAKFHIWPGALHRRRFPTLLPEWMTNGFVLRAKFMLDNEWASVMAMMASVSLSEAKICCPLVDMAWASPSVLVQTVPFSFRASYSTQDLPHVRHGFLWKRYSKSNIHEGQNGCRASCRRDATKLKMPYIGNADVILAFPSRFFLMCDILHTTSKNSYCCLKMNTSIRRKKYGLSAPVAQWLERWTVEPSR